jgi:hypothetical protein
VKKSRLFGRISLPRVFRFTVKDCTGEIFCRFGFPKECREASAYTKDADREFPELHTRRNDELLNSYNPGIILSWRANIDFRPVINREAVIAYVAKIC